MSGRPETDADVLTGPGVAVRTARGTGVRLVAYVLSSLLSVVSAAVLLRYLGVDGYGRYVTVFALITIVAGVTEAGTANVGVRELATRATSERERLMATLQGVRLALTVAGMVLALLFVVAGEFADAMVEGAALAGLGLVLTVAACTLWVPMQADLRLAAVAGLELLRQALTVVVLLALVLAGAGLVALLAAQIPVAIALGVASLAAARVPASALRPSFDAAAWRRLLAETLPYAVATAIGLVYSSSVLLVMSVVATETQTGLFGAATRIFVVLAGVAGILVGSALPVLARAGRDDRERLRGAVRRLSDAVAFVATGVALVTAAGAAVAIDVVAGPDFADATEVLRVLAPALIASYFLTLGAFVLLALGRQRVLIAVNGAGLLVAVVLALVVTPEHGALGGAVAALIGEWTIAALTFAALAGERLVPSPRVLLRVVLCAGLAAVPAFALGLPALAAAVAAALVYAAAGWWLGIVPVEAAEALRRPRPSSPAPPR